MDYKRNEKFEFVGVEIIKLRSGYADAVEKFENNIFDHYLLFDEEGNNYNTIWELIANVPEERSGWIKDHPQYTVVEPFYVLYPTFLGNGSDYEGASMVEDELEVERDWLGDEEKDSFEQRAPEMLRFALANAFIQKSYKGEHYYLTTIWKWWETLDENGDTDDHGLELVGYVNYHSVMKYALLNVIEAEPAHVAENVSE